MPLLNVEHELSERHTWEIKNFFEEEEEEEGSLVPIKLTQRNVWILYVPLEAVRVLQKLNISLSRWKRKYITLQHTSNIFQQAFWSSTSELQETDSQRLNYLLKMVNVTYTPHNRRIWKSTGGHPSMEIKFPPIALPSCNSLLPLLLTFYKDLHGKDH